ncbi:MAG: hypothetical protein Kow0013_17090 [Pararhodobacter sp.]
MRFPLLAILVCLALPAGAEVSHRIEGRFGVGYSSEVNGGRARPIYEGLYSTRFDHRTDGGIRFRFDIGVVVSNFDSLSPRRPMPPMGLPTTD